ncbi:MULTISPECIES: hypothetical protein [Trichocoleus]|uniref:Uncharacterized protein n=1 Tax=Trichocoleus desertorum GB2-A4 TaxID=2933944 RepID=A0ABV0JD05_9CYAN|nr:MULTISPECIES: hypothetical protein [unclassified Trichocoleus]MBD1860949.1 hypothetical protein [Trichocoleus sp. FACHB-46]MBD2097104.1 hypothetical protein [Trichocoleus sp. FACHB-591]
MTEKNVEQQAAEINQEVQALVEKTDECAAQIDMEEMLKVGKKTAQELQQPTEG